MMSEVREDLLDKILDCGCDNVNYGWLGGALVRVENYHDVLTEEEKQILEERQRERHQIISRKGRNSEKG